MTSLVEAASAKETLHSNVLRVLVDVHAHDCRCGMIHVCVPKSPIRRRCDDNDERTLCQFAATRKRDVSSENEQSQFAQRYTKLLGTVE